MKSDIEKVLISEDSLKEKVCALAARITADYKDRELLIISVLKGGFIFAADLMRAMDLDVSIDFIAVSSYGASSKSSGVVKIIKDLDRDVRGKNILIVEDIVDSGLTLKYLKELLIGRGAADIKICTILNKPSRRKTDIYVDYIGFDIPDEFVIGYGLDYDERYRALPYIGVLKRCVYEK
jgi:hypoxanthine phosphoribosyltransferase